MLLLLLLHRRDVLLGRPRTRARGDGARRVHRQPAEMPGWSGRIGLTSHRKPETQLETARSRLYRRRFWPPNNHFSAFFEIYKIFTILRRSNHKILQKFFKNFMILKKISQNFENFQNFRQF